MAFLLLHSCGRQGEYPREIGAENPLPIIHPPASLALTHTGPFPFVKPGGKGLHYGQSFAIQPSIGGKWYTVQGIQLDFVAIAFDLGLGKA